MLIIATRNHVSNHAFIDQMMLFKNGEWKPTKELSQLETKQYLQYQSMINLIETIGILTNLVILSSIMFIQWADLANDSFLHL